MTAADGKYGVPTRFGAMVKAANGRGTDGAPGLGSASVSPTPWQDDQFVLAADGAQDFELTFLPIPSSQHVSLGPPLLEGEDYTMDGATLHLLVPAPRALTGDVLDVRYQYSADEPTPFVPSAGDDLDLWFRDDFNRAPGPVGNGWTVLAGDPEVSGNQLVNGSPGTEMLIVRETSSDVVNVASVFDLSEAGSGIIFRVQDANNFLALIIGDGTNSLSWYKKEAGVLSAYTGLLLGPTFGATFRVTGTAAGIYRCFMDDVEIFPHLETTDFLAETQVGLRAQTATSPLIDDFECLLA